jgi:hypothetical protein
MKRIFVSGILAFSLALSFLPALAQQGSPLAEQVGAESDAEGSAANVTNPSPVPLEWTPPALDALSREAPMKSTFTLDRNLLGIAAGMLPDADATDRQVIRKLDGVSVHSLRFADAGIPDEGAVDSIRAAYHLRGWKHLVTTSRSGGPIHNDTTDLWVVLDGANVRGAVILAETPHSLTLVTVAGNLSPVDLLHLRGHFGIPRFEGDGMREMH